MEGYQAQELLSQLKQQERITSQLVKIVANTNRQVKVLQEKIERIEANRLINKM